MAHKAGFVNIIGSPNVGKSTLMNALVGEKVSIINAKAQTTRHRIHIAGLSPYQRRVARIGNGLEISDDDEWDDDRADHVTGRSSPVIGRLNSASNLTSLPVNINQDFILKRPSTSSTSDNIRRSLEILKDSNEGNPELVSNSGTFERI